MKLELLMELTPLMELITAGGDTITFYAHISSGWIRFGTNFWWDTTGDYGVKGTFTVLIE